MQWPHSTRVWGKHDVYVGDDSGGLSSLAVDIDAILSVGYATLGNGTELLLLAAVRLFAVILRSGDDNMYLRR